MTRKRRLLIAALICFSIAVLCALCMGQGDEKPWAYRALQTGYAIGQGVDLGMSWVSTKYLGARESNPILGALTIKSPVGALVFDGAVTLGVVALSDLLWKKNRTIGWIVTVALVAIKGYVLWHNFGALESKSREE